jgi:co-chaperonin GroES (HSP10)
MQYGSAIGLSGANAGLRRAITAVSSGASVTTTVYFPSSVAVGDKVLVLPYKPGSVAVQTTAAFSQANAIIAVGTGIDADVLDIQIDKPINSTNPVAWVYFMFGDHNFNQLA